MRRALLSLLFACATAVADAPALAPAQFADGYTVLTAEPAGIYRVTLPLAVYRSVQRADMGDLRVFNASGEAVPHAIAPPPAATAAAPTVALPFFPLRTPAADATPGALHIRIDASGALIDTTPAEASAQPFNALIVDTGEQASAITALVLRWTAGDAGFVTRIGIASSADLLAWQPVTEATLAELRQGDYRLRQDTVAVRLPAQRYLRIGWRHDDAMPALTAIEARLRPATPAPVQETLKIAGVPATAPDTGTVFDTEARLPASGAALVLPADNTLARVRWFSRASADAPWRELGTTLAYRMRADASTTLSGGELALAPTRDRYWRVAVIDGDAAAAGARLRLTWTPEDVLFMARGNAPFQLAAGSASVTAGGESMDALLGSLGSAAAPLIAPAMLDARTTLGGAQALVPATPPRPWQRYLLWVVLVAAVGLLARMALQLQRQMNAPPEG